MKKKVFVVIIAFIIVLMLNTTAITAVAASDGTNTYSIFTAKAYGQRVGDDIKIYSAPSTNASVITTVLDGTEIAVTECEVEGYYTVILDEGIGYVLTENVTNGLSYNQRVALVIGIVAVVTVILILIITYFRRNADYLKSKRR